MSLRSLSILASMLAALSACRSSSGSAAGSSSEEPPAAPASAPASRPAAQEAPVTQHPTLQPQIDAARAELAERLGVSADSIELVSAQHVTWRNGALGCPKPDAFYTQALVEGARIILRHGALDHAYHSGAEGEPFYCVTPEAPSTNNALQ